MSQRLLARSEHVASVVWFVMLLVMAKRRGLSLRTSGPKLTRKSLMIQDGSSQEAARTTAKSCRSARKRGEPSCILGVLSVCTELRTESRLEGLSSGAGGLQKLGVVEKTPRLTNRG